MLDQLCRWWCRCLGYGVAAFRLSASAKPGSTQLPKTMSMNLSVNSLASAKSISGGAEDFFSRALVNREIWMFAYDAWMVRPSFACRQRVPALVRGWRRSVAGMIEMSNELPLSLLPNGSVHGMLLQYSDESLLSDLTATWSYWVEVRKLRPIWVKAKCSFGDVEAVAFVARENIVDSAPIDFLLRGHPEQSAIKEAALKAKELNDLLALAGRGDRYLQALGRDLAVAGFAKAKRPVSR